MAPLNKIEREVRATVVYGIVFIPGMISIISAFLVMSWYALCGILIPDKKREYEKICQDRIYTVFDRYSCFIEKFGERL